MVRISSGGIIILGTSPLLARKASALYVESQERRKQVGLATTTGRPGKPQPLELSEHDYQL